MFVTCIHRKRICTDFSVARNACVAWRVSVFCCRMQRDAIQCNCRLSANRRDESRQQNLLVTRYHYFDQTSRRLSFPAFFLVRLLNSARLFRRDCIICISSAPIIPIIPLEIFVCHRRETDQCKYVLFDLWFWHWQRSLSFIIVPYTESVKQTNLNCTY